MNMTWKKLFCISDVFTYTLIGVIGIAIATFAAMQFFDRTPEPSMQFVGTFAWLTFVITMAWGIYNAVKSRVAQYRRAINAEG